MFIVKVVTSTNAEMYVDAEKVTHVRPMAENTTLFMGSEHLTVALPVDEVLSMLGWSAIMDYSKPRAPRAE